MPATKAEITNKDDFRGDILDRDFPVRFDNKTGMYTYDYAELTPQISAELSKIKFYRVSSPKLSDVEGEINKVARQPRVKGEIAKETEAMAEQSKFLMSAYGNLNKKERAGTITPEESALKKNMEKESRKLLRSKKVDYAKRQQQKLDNAYEKRVQEGIQPVIRNPAGRIVMDAADKTLYDSYSSLIKAAEVADELEGKEKAGTVLTPQEVTKKTAAVAKINSFELPDEEIPDNSTKAINEKANYNEARALTVQLQNIPNNKQTAEQKAKLMKAFNTIMKYESTHREALQKFVNQEALMTKGKEEKEYRNAKQKIANLNKKTKPLSAPNAAEKLRLEGVVAAYRAANPNANENVPSTEGLFTLPAKFEGFENVKGGYRKTRKHKKRKHKSRKHKLRKHKSYKKYDRGRIKWEKQTTRHNERQKKKNGETKEQKFRVRDPMMA